MHFSFDGLSGKLYPVGEDGTVNISVMIPSTECRIFYSVNG